MDVKKIIAYFIIAVLVCSALYMFSTRVYDNAAGVDATRNGISASTESNLKLQGQLEAVTGTANEIEGSISRSTDAIASAETAAGSITSDLDVAADAIAKCQRIIDGIKQRNEAAAAQP